VTGTTFAMPRSAQSLRHSGRTQVKSFGVV
jgi:hypothetical protein